MRKKSVDLKRLQGSFRPDRKASGCDVAPLESAPEPPACLDADERTVWLSLAGVLCERKLLTSLDLQTFEIFCVTYAQWQRITKDLKEKGFTYTNNGLQKARPECGVLKELLNALDVLAKKFGLSPQDRQRLAVQPQEESDELEKYLACGRALSV